MATITITQHSRYATDANGLPMPVPADFIADETLTAAGESAAMAAGTRFVRIATDTAMTVDAYGAGSEALLPANSVELFPAREGQTFTFAALA